MARDRLSWRSLDGREGRSQSRVSAGRPSDSRLSVWIWRLRWVSVVGRGLLSLKSAGTAMRARLEFWRLGCVAPFTWGRPRLGIQPVSPALAGGFPATEPPGKSLTEFFKKAFLTQAVEKAMATHSSVLAWKIPWTEEPGGLQSMGLLRVRHN